jgi:hypothetical protein
MTDNAKTVNLTDYRSLASYVLVLFELQRMPRARLELLLRTEQSAQWLAGLLARRGYTVLAVGVNDEDGGVVTVATP